MIKSFSKNNICEQDMVFRIDGNDYSMHDLIARLIDAEAQICVLNEKVAELDTRLAQEEARIF